MIHELVITDQDLKTRFHNERDLVTLSPYRAGDRVVRCLSCRSIVKSEFVTGRCPICGHSPFLPAPVNVIETRSLTSFLWLLLLSGAAALIPFAFPGMADFICEAAFGTGFYCSMIYVGTAGFIAVLVTYYNQKFRRMWQLESRGGLLILIPAGAPYLILGAVWATIFIISMIIVIACIIGIIAVMSE